MSPQLAREIQDAQNHGRQKYGNGPDDFAHDDAHENGTWYKCIEDHNARSMETFPMDRREHLVKLAGLAVSAIESFDRKRK